MRKTISLIVLIAMLILIPDPVFAFRTGSGWSEQDLQIPGTIQFQTDIFATGHSAGSTTLASTVTPLTAANIAFGLVRIANGSPGTHPLPNGVTGKAVTFELIADPTYVITSDLTHTGWETITFDDAHDKVTVLWLDDTTGWIITSNSGCTITY